MTASPRIVIVGAGQAGAQVAFSLRQDGFEGEIEIIGEEPHLPYQRPPLSKSVLLGKMSPERLHLRPAQWYASNHVKLHLSRKVSAIDPSRRHVRLDDASRIEFDHLVIATGARPRSLPIPGANFSGVFSLRDLADVARLKPRLEPSAKIVIVGAGYIGLEAAAALRERDLSVTVVEQADHVLARVASPPVSLFFAQEHSRRGVDIRPRTVLDAIVVRNDKVAGIRLADGGLIAADAVLVGIGVVPNDDLAADAGLDCADGIMVDQDSRTSAPGIYACGDCTRRPIARYNRHGRLESVHNAIEQAKQAAAAILGKPRPPDECPWFWSDQYDLKLQTAGLSAGYDQIVMRGDPADRRFAAFYFAAGRLLAVDAVNAPPEFMVSKRWIETGAAVGPDVVADTALSMKQIAERVAKEDPHFA